MSLQPGARLGPYEVVGLIGVGGMGEVYEARDTRLDRTVAIKVLPPDLNTDPERRARFEREAKTISQLNHPHICTLHDIGQHDGTTYLVMEHLGGETLAQRLRKGPLPLPQALDYAAQIADALAAAHRQGVFHRDLKPGNVMLTRTGAKLLDFGLAKLQGQGERPAAGHLTSALTEATPLTATGTIVGTLHYMAPEQVEGKPADARTDVWALGATLYEMLTGQRAFAATSAASLIGAILERDPAPVSAFQPLTPPGVDRLVRKCLAKAPDERWDAAHDVADELRWLRETSGVAAGTAVRPRRRWGLRAKSPPRVPPKDTGALYARLFRERFGGGRPCGDQRPPTPPPAHVTGRAGRRSVWYDGAVFIHDRSDERLVARRSRLGSDSQRGPSGVASLASNQASRTPNALMEAPMKRAALVVVALYAAALVALTWPLSRISFWGEGVDVSSLFAAGPYWAFIGVMVAGQVLLLVVPVRVASRRPVSRRAVIWPVLASGLAVGLLVLAALGAVTEFFQQDVTFLDTSWGGWIAIGVGAASWLVWSVVFYRTGASASPQDVVSRHCRLMLRGSVLEFLVAVPMHIVARHRGYCCAGFYTFTGIAVGIAVVLLSFGPAVFVLVVNRWRAQHPVGTAQP